MPTVQTKRVRRMRMKRRERDAEVLEVEEGDDVAVLDHQTGRKGNCIIVRIYLQYTQREKVMGEKVK